MFRCVVLAVMGVALLDFSTLAAPAQDTANQHADSTPQLSQRNLIRLLGSPKFLTREFASQKLASQGLAAREALEEALKDPDLEIRTRARWILERVLREEFERRVAAFISDRDGREQVHFPGWEQFKGLVGDNRDARKMFIEMVRSEISLLSAYEQRSPKLPELFAVRMDSLKPSGTSGAIQPAAVAPQAVATLLLIAADQSGELNLESVNPLFELLSHPAIKQSISGGVHASIVRALLGKWLIAVSLNQSQKGMMLALKYDLKETGLQQAKQLIGQPNTSPSMLEYAILAIGRFGEKEHIPLLTPLLSNKEVCHRWSNSQLKKDGVIKTEVRDVALVILLHLKGKDPGQFGFRLLRDNPETLYYVYTCGFLDNNQREAAHAKWAEASKVGKD